MFIADTNTSEPCVFRSLEVGDTFVILSYSEAKRANLSFVWCDLTE